MSAFLPRQGKVWSQILQNMRARVLNGWICIKGWVAWGPQAWADLSSLLRGPNAICRVPVVRDGLLRVFLSLFV